MSKARWREDNAKTDAELSPPKSRRTEAGRMRTGAKLSPPKSQRGNDGGGDDDDSSSKGGEEDGEATRHYDM